MLDAVPDTTIIQYHGLNVCYAALPREFGFYPGFTNTVNLTLPCPSRAH